MQRMIFVNLPVADLDAARAFYAGLGFSFNDTFSNDSCAYVSIEDNIAIMLLTKERFSDFVTGEISDAHTSTEALVCLSAESRDEVDSLYRKAIDSGGKPWLPVQDLGFMYGHSFQDPDGHVLEVMWMDPAAVASGVCEDGAHDHEGASAAAR